MNTYEHGILSFSFRFYRLRLFFDSSQVDILKDKEIFLERMNSFLNEDFSCVTVTNQQLESERSGKEAKLSLLVFFTTIN